MTQPRNAEAPSFTPDDGEQILDNFQGVQLYWTHVTQGGDKQRGKPQDFYDLDVQQAYHTEMDLDAGGNHCQSRAFQLIVQQKVVDHTLIRAYLQHIQAAARDIVRQNSELQVSSYHPTAIFHVIWFCSKPNLWTELVFAVAVHTRSLYCWLSHLENMQTIIHKHSTSHFDDAYVSLHASILQLKFTAQDRSAETVHNDHSPSAR